LHGMQADPGDKTYPGTSDAVSPILDPTRCPSRTAHTPRPVGARLPRG
jgi:hypothetical protein